MANIIIDTNNVRGKISDFNRSCNELSNNIDNLSATINQVVNVQWSGKANNSFAQYVNKDIDIYNKHISKLNEHRNNLEIFCDEVERIIAQCNF